MVAALIRTPEGVPVKIRSPAWRKEFLLSSAMIVDIPDHVGNIGLAVLCIDVGVMAPDVRASRADNRADWR
jgi:hypothetical protein